MTRRIIRLERTLPPKAPKPAPAPPPVLSRDEARDVARELAERSETFLDGLKDGQLGSDMLADNSTAAVAHDLFELRLFGLVLRLDEAEREGLVLRPYDVQIEARVAMLELGAFAADEPMRRWGAGLLYLHTPDGWRLADVLPIGAGGMLNPDDPAEAPIIAAYRTIGTLPIDSDGLDAVERALVAGMADDSAFNLEELVNGIRLWRDYIRRGGMTNGAPALWAAGIAYLIGLFDRRTVSYADTAAHYRVSADGVSRRARELADTLNATQFDDRYATRADPVAHYAEVFGEIGVNFGRGGLQEDFDGANDEL